MEQSGTSALIRISHWTSSGNELECRYATTGVGLSRRYDTGAGATADRPVLHAPGPVPGTRAGGLPVDATCTGTRQGADAPSTARGAGRIDLRRAHIYETAPDHPQISHHQRLFKRPDHGNFALYWQHLLCKDHRDDHSDSALSWHRAPAQHERSPLRQHT